MPEVIVIDEIGTQLETQAARTIAERGVQLVATAHGNTLENLMMNPTLADLIGGIQSVTLGDEEAKRRGTQKSILERMSAPTFDILVEIQERDIVAIHADVASAVDAILLGDRRPWKSGRSMKRPANWSSNICSQKPRTTTEDRYAVIKRRRRTAPARSFSCTA